MRSNKVIFVALSLFVFFAGLLARAGAPNGVAISGTVVDASGAVIAGATVQVRSADGVCLKRHSRTGRIFRFFWTRGRQLPTRRIESRF